MTILISDIFSILSIIGPLIIKSAKELSNALGNRITAKRMKDVNEDDVFSKKIDKSEL